MSDTSKRSLVRRVLGPDAAQHDLNLFDYLVKSQTEVSQPILIGRWGTGKTSILRARCNELLEYYGDDSVEFFKNSNICLIEEHEINAIIVSEEISSSGRKEHERRFIFEAMWQIEILRRVSLMLIYTKKKEENKLSGAHWSKMNLDYVVNNVPSNVWKSVELVSSIARSVIGFDILNKNSSENIKNFYSDDRYNIINKCIADLIDHDIPIPIVCIEPIETPLARIEKSRSLANELVASLLNCWYAHFCDERPGNLVSVHISIPWHRFDLSMLNAPQKIESFTGNVAWERENLRELINRRLSWHMQLCPTRAFQHSELIDPWKTYFPEKIENTSQFDGRVGEECSFDYVCRHSSWRARDLIRLVRACIVEQCNGDFDKAWEFFDSGEMVGSEAIQDGIASQSYSIADERLIEAHTKFSNFEIFERQDYVDSILRGIDSPLSQEDFVKIMTFRVNEVSGEYLEDFLNRLWEAEIIGFVVEFSTSDDKYSNLIKRYISISKGDYIEIDRSARDRKNVDRVGFIYSYSTKKARNFGQLMREFPDALIAVNPVFNEFFNIHVSSPYPIGR